MRSFLAILLLVLWTGEVRAQNVDNDLPRGPYVDCWQLEPGLRFLCLILNSSYREPKLCPEIGQHKSVPQSASCERGNDREPRQSRQSREPRGGGCHK